MKFLILTPLAFVFSACTTLAASNAPVSQLYNGNTLRPAQVADMTAQIRPGSVLVLGEAHYRKPFRDQHMAVLEALRAGGLKVSVGLEFLNYTDQPFTEQYRSGEISEEAFKNLVGWGAGDFGLYRDQLLFPLATRDEFGLGLNVPRTVTQQISKGGLDSLTPVQRALLPIDFTVGRASYKERFVQAVGTHLPPELLENSFVAQSAWDDAMALQSAKFMQAHPDQVLVIVVGEFHVQYGGGLPDRLRARLPGVTIHSLSQVWAEGLTDDEIQTELQPSVVDGARADFIWVTRP